MKSLHLIFLFLKFFYNNARAILTFIQDSVAICYFWHTVIILTIVFSYIISRIIIDYWYVNSEKVGRRIFQKTDGENISIVNSWVLDLICNVMVRRIYITEVFCMQLRAIPLMYNQLVPRQAVVLTQKTWSFSFRIPLLPLSCPTLSEFNIF